MAARYHKHERGTAPTGNGYDLAEWEPLMVDTVRNVYPGKILWLNLERVTLPNGRVAELEIAHHPGGACIVALDAQDRVCLLRQFRHATGGWITELPAGKLEQREPPIECAQRELGEEAGVAARRWDFLGQFYTSPGVLTEVIHVFLARDLEPCTARLDEHEVLDVRWVALREAFELAASARLQDAKTLVGLAWAQAFLASRR